MKDCGQLSLRQAQLAACAELRRWATAATAAARASGASAEGALYSSRASQWRQPSVSVARQRQPKRAHTIGDSWLCAHTHRPTHQMIFS